VESLIDTCYHQEAVASESVAFSDLAVKMFAQLMYGAIIAVMLKMTATGNYNFQLPGDKLDNRFIELSYQRSPDIIGGFILAE